MTMKIYTKTGDAGQTGLFGGARVSKASERVGAYGEIDELNSVIGLARAHGLESRKNNWLARIQSELFDLGAELSTVQEKQDSVAQFWLGDEDIAKLEAHIDELETELAPLKAFVLPGGSTTASALHLARTVCRRAERSLVALAAGEPVRPEVLRYVNRLSDLLFVMARSANRDEGLPDVPWLGRNNNRG
jgi:cob(I)alamin adenosyltransferase